AICSVDSLVLTLTLQMQEAWAHDKGMPFSHITMAYPRARLPLELAVWWTLPVPPQLAGGA
ncbi:hypothetical protein, partial [Achromobacter mucicolens]|uniref:hypothetical protein n=1 Tax=Achromobacter mucicolens TaxID=1389922 RepID=UPI002FE1D155